MAYNCLVADRGERTHRMTDTTENITFSHPVVADKNLTNLLVNWSCFSWNCFLASFTQMILFEYYTYFTIYFMGGFSKV